MVLTDVHQHSHIQLHTLYLETGMKNKNLLTYMDKYRCTFYDYLGRGVLPVPDLELYGPGVLVDFQAKYMISH